jgi:hypothetical protein
MLGGVLQAGRVDQRRPPHDVFELIGFDEKGELPSKSVDVGHVGDYPIGDWDGEG